mgnify:FL=1
MKTSKTIELTEEDVNAAVRMYVKDRLAPNEVTGDIKYITRVRGDYDTGTAKEYVKSVYIEVNQL